MNEPSPRLSRRNFLLTLGAGGAATAAAIVAKAPATAPVGAAGDARRASRGYRASEHVSNYYRTTKI